MTTPRDRYEDERQSTQVDFHRQLVTKGKETAQKSPPQESCFFGSFLHSLIKK
jgi:hypothetical protein